MKKWFLSIGFLIVLFSFKSITQDTEDVITALKTGNATEVASYFDNLIDLTLPDKDELKNISKNQATIAIKSFFDENGIKGFNLTSQRESGQTMYIAGKLQGRIDNKNITILLKKNTNKVLIISMRIG
ncbi:MAG: DUF4783 domain-containing protein [Chitinophagaceae bacterium]|jgi:hypothetical protein